ncbi:MAG: glycosyltransferase [Erysipelotrichaceae bacterium]|nr:glycosyltransferase [Erysipelotrichaceae bacterium]
MAARVERTLKKFASDEISLAVTYSSCDGKETLFIDDGITYYPIDAGLSVGLSQEEWEHSRCKLLNVIDDFQPDLIQCFGSEYPFGVICKDVSVPVVIHMMGFLNIYYMTIDSVIHYSADDDPNKDLTVVKVIDEERPDRNEIDQFARKETFNSAVERKTMELNRYFFDRTAWDERIVRYFSGGKYYHIEEPINHVFYDSDRRWNFTKRDRIKLLSVSSSDHRKGNEIVLRTARILKDIMKMDFEWIVTSNSESFAPFEKRTGIRHEDVDVRLVGYLSAEQIKEELMNADFFIHPSIIDNSPNSICEAQLIGTPVIASDVGGVSSLVKDGYSGFLYPYNEPHTLAFLIGDLCASEACLKQVSANEISTSLERHDPKKIAESLLSAYKEIINDFNNIRENERNADLKPEYDSILSSNTHAETPIIKSEDYETRLEKAKDQIFRLKRKLDKEKQINKSDELMIRDLQNRIQIAENKEENAEYQYHMIKDATFWRMTKSLRKTIDGMKRVPGVSDMIADIRKVVRKDLQHTRNTDYIRYLNTVFYDENIIRQRSCAFPENKLISIVVPLYNTGIRYLKEMIDSVINQTYSDWQLCLADGSDSSHRKVGNLCRNYSGKDKRICYKKLDRNHGISENTNRCLEMAKGEYVAFLDHDDVLHPSALFKAMEAITGSGADFIYSDEATFRSPDLEDIELYHHKPDYAPDNLRANNYICHFTVFRKELLDKTGSLRSEYDGSQDHDLFLRLTSVAEKIIHIPEVLYFWRAHPESLASSIDAKDYAAASGIRAVQNFINTTEYPGRVESSTAFPTIYRIRYDIIAQPKISIVIPSCDHIDDLDKCIRSIEELSTYRNFDIAVVENNSLDADTFEYYEKICAEYENVKVIRWDHEFNFAAINNFAVKQTDGEYILLLNNDTEVITPEWIEEMLMYGQRKDVGITGAMLYYPDDTIQHAGVVLGLGGVAAHAFSGVKRGTIGYMGKLHFAQDMSAVTAACMLVKRELWDEIGGMNTDFAVNFNDVDFCMRVRKKGYLVVWTPYAELYHYESKTRGSDVEDPVKASRFASEISLFRKIWKNELEKGDPYYNSNFSLSVLYQKTRF